MFLTYQSRIGGFTLFEILVVTGVLSLLMGTLFFGYQNLMGSFRKTEWKQERLSQIGKFWTLLRRNLEEAADEHDLTTGDLVTVPCPLLFRTIPSSLSGTLRDGDLMRFRRFRLSGSGIADYRLCTKLAIIGNQVFFEVNPLSESAPSAEIIVPAKKVLDDVSSFAIRSTRIRQSPTRGDYFDDGNTSSDKIVGSIVEISITFSPSSKYSGSNQQGFAQSNKFKIAVDSIQTTENIFP